VLLLHIVELQEQEYRRLLGVSSLDLLYVACVATQCEALWLW